MNIFISHSTLEAELAKYLATWLQENMANVQCFCSSRREDLPPGLDWLKEICTKAKESDLCLMLMSPYSSINNWLHFEVGMVLGADINNKAIPVFYGGLSTDSSPKTIRHLQCLDLQNKADFESFILKYLSDKGRSQNDYYDAFLNGMTSKIRRTLQFGLFGTWDDGYVKTDTLSIGVLKGNQDHPIHQHAIPRYNGAGEVIAIRTKIIPRRLGVVQHWKFGIELRESGSGQSKSIFQFHSGCHMGINSWTTYVTDKAHVAINQPARIETEKTSGLYLWIREKGKRVGCVGIDSEGKYTIIGNDRGENCWLLASSSWTEIVIAGWADGIPFQIDVESIEVDRS